MKRVNEAQLLGFGTLGVRVDETSGRWFYPLHVNLLVRSRRLELPRVLPHSDLNAARLPFRHDRIADDLMGRYIAKRQRHVKRQITHQIGVNLNAYRTRSRRPDIRIPIRVSIQFSTENVGRPAG